MTTLRDLLRLGGIDAYDAEPTITPQGMYAVVTTDPGRGSHYGIHGMPRRTAASDQVRLVAKSADGAIALAAKARRAVESPDCRVIGSIPLYPDGPDSDRRMNATIILSTYQGVTHDRPE